MRLLNSIRHRLARLGQRGTAAIEFAITGACFMLMVLASFEMGYMLFVQQALDNAARAAARSIRTGEAQSAASPTTAFSTLLCAGVSSLIACGNLVYQAQVFNDWPTAQTAVTTPPARDKNGKFTAPAGFSAGTPGQILVVTVTYNYPFLTPWIGGLLGGGTKSALLSSTVVFQNEPY